MRCHEAARRWQRAMVVFTCTATVVAGAAMVAAAPIGALVAGASPTTAPALPASPGSAPGLLDESIGSRVLPLAGAKPVPQSWPHPEPLYTGDATGVDAGRPFKSTNWSGYIDSGPGAHFTKVTASWTVPVVKAGPAGYSSSWVGIDGVTNQNLIQAGTEQDWGPFGEVYYAWYELLPADSFYLGAVYPGDKISVDISRAGDATWTITIDDVTRRTVWSGAVSYSTPETSAEWVEEAPTNGSTAKLYPLANFGSVQFSGLGVAGPGTSGATVSPVYMVTKKGGPIRAYPSEYSQGSDSFGIAYGQPAEPPPPVPTVPVVMATSPTPTTTTTTAPPPTTATTAPAPLSPGYWLASLDGGVFAFGGAKFLGSSADVGGSSPQLSEVTGIASTPDGHGYWLVTVEGGIFPFGDARYLGSVVALNATTTPVLSIAATADGGGYYMLSATGGVYTFGDAKFYGACTEARCGKNEAVDLVTAPSGNGYWLLLSDCTMVPFGNAPAIADRDCQDYSAAAKVGARSATSTPDGHGYWALMLNGTIFAEGDANSYGSWPGTAVPVKGDPAVALVPTASGKGAWLVLASGTVEDLGDAPDLGSLAGIHLAAPVFAAASPG